jgi:hypothetical protein
MNKMEVLAAWISTLASDDHRTAYTQRTGFAHNAGVAFVFFHIRSNILP